MKNETNQPESATPLEMELHQAKPHQLARLEENPLAAIGGFLQAAFDKGITEANVAVAEKLIGLVERLNDKKAEQEFNAAFVAVQRDLPKIQANQPVPNNDGTIRYKFAPYEKIMEQVAPVLKKHGFTVSFSQKFSEGRVIQQCTLRHTSGHSAVNEFAVRIGKGPPGSSEAQGDGAASTYAKRFALCDCLNITIEKDNDGRILGEPIGPVAGAALRKRVQASKSDEASFLGLAGVPPLADTASEQDVIAAYASIPSASVSILEELLTRKERKK